MLYPESERWHFHCTCTRKVNSRSSDIKDNFFFLSSVHSTLPLQLLLRLVPHITAAALHLSQIIPGDSMGRSRLRRYSLCGVSHHATDQGPPLVPEASTSITEFVFTSLGHLPTLSLLFPRAVKFEPLRGSHVWIPVVVRVRSALHLVFLAPLVIYQYYAANS